MAFVAPVAAISARVAAPSQISASCQKPAAAVVAQQKSRFVAGQTVGKRAFFGRAQQFAAPVAGPSTQAVKPISMAASIEELKKLAAEKAVDMYFKDDMVVGLGTGSTAAYAVAHVGKRLKEGSLKNIVAIPTSERTYEQAKSLGIPLSTLDIHPKIAVTIDGADEVCPKLDLVKGRGGALLREKMVELASEKFIVIVDDTKLVPGLGVSGAMPVEVVKFCWDFNAQRIREALGCQSQLRDTGNRDEYTVYETDNSNYIVDLYFDKPIPDSKKAAQILDSYVGVVEHGLFLDMATSVIVAASEGVYELKHKDPSNRNSEVVKTML
eukprot:tig00000551_g2026.t1